MKIKICIPHFFSKEPKNNYNLPGGQIPGSARGTTEKRKISFDKCPLSLINQSKVNDYEVLDIRFNTFKRVQRALNKYNISISIVTDGKNFCEKILDKYRNFIEVKKIDLDDPKNLIFEAREYLLSFDDCDLYYYEDDIGIITKNYFDRVKWFAEQTKHKAVLMPHRFENPYSPEVEKLYIDGPIDQNFLTKFMTPQQNALLLSYQGKNLIF